MIKKIAIGLFILSVILGSVMMKYKNPKQDNLPYAPPHIPENDLQQLNGERM